MSINWYPGHMVKAKREIKENLKLVDVVVMLLDARAPFSCRNMDLEAIVGNKPIILVLNKMDLAAPEKVQSYLKTLRSESFAVVPIDSITGKGSKEVLHELRKVYKPIADQMLERGRRVRPARVMVVGVPNVGKSTFLNCMVGKKIARTGAKPGVTKGKQWIRVREDIEFMDTPGLMWPKIKDEEQGYKLSLLNIIGENAYNEYNVALFLIGVLRKIAPEALQSKFKLDSIDGTSEEVLQAISRKKGHLVKGGELNLELTSAVLLNDFRKGNIAHICLD
ncbi:MAG TPA: ribosome biogenesis GTPase YlqF [Syntrophomonadaceae bacterium]|nr:ribosome biogenesis GTPase YlqF [Syntrophomonadaceae bacterium]